MRIVSLLGLSFSVFLFANSALPAQEAKVDPLLGKWERKETVEGKDLVGQIEFAKDGKLTLTLMGFNFDGTYKVLDEKNMEVSLKIGDKSTTQKMSYKVEKDSLEMSDLKNKMQKFTRVK
jgi:uncharacterized protein (TIGR03066 family)